ncbi:LysR family transcriptional regulator [Luteibacter sp. PPL201]|uniref:LysR family transcriptional regulator n=1 Tax=Luteibacter sahnii TaxID=3021977 RepID=A0ABT6BFD6_9GAMM
MRPTQFDLDALRGFVTGVDAGSFTRAAERLHRSTSAVSAQLKKLEAQAGVPLFRKAGRGLSLTDGGEALLSYARRLLELNDEAISAVRGVSLEGWIRLGLQEDFGETLLPDVLGRFARAHPRVRIEGRIARNTELLDRLADGHLDLVLAWDFEPTGGRRIASVPLHWLGSASVDTPYPLDEPLPLVALEAPCVLRTLACEQLDRQGRAWRIAFVTPSLGGLWAATAAGLGTALRTPVGLPASVRPLDPAAHGLPVLPALGLALYRADRDPSPIARHLEAIIEQALREGLPTSWTAGHAGADAGT